MSEKRIDFLLPARTAPRRDERRRHGQSRFRAGGPLPKDFPFERRPSGAQAERTGVDLVDARRKRCQHGHAGIPARQIPHCTKASGIRIPGAMAPGAAAQ